MSRENVEVVLEMLDAFNRGDSASLEGAMSPDVVVQDYPGIPGAGWHRGFEGAARWAVNIWEAFGRVHFEAAEVTEVSRILTKVRVSGRGKRSGAAVELIVYAVFTVREGLMTRMEVYETEQEALELPAEARQPVSPNAAPHRLYRPRCDRDSCADHRCRDGCRPCPYWLPTASADEGRYLCAVLNSRPLHERIKAGLSKGLYGERNIHRAPFTESIPEYDPDDSTHLDLAEAGRDAEDVAATIDLEAVRSTATARQRVRAAVIEEGVAARIEALVETLLAD